MYVYFVMSICTIIVSGSDILGQIDYSSDNENSFGRPVKLLLNNV